MESTANPIYRSHDPAKFWTKKSYKGLNIRDFTSKHHLFDGKFTPTNPNMELVYTPEVNLPLTLHMCSETYDVNRQFQGKTSKYYKKLSYRRETALQGALVFDKSGRMGLGDDILGHLQLR